MTEPIRRKTIILAFLLLLLNNVFLFRITTTQSFTANTNFRSPSVGRNDRQQRQPPWTTTLLCIKNTRAMEVIHDHRQWICNKKNDTTTKSPFIAIVTEPDACDSDERYEITMNALYQAISTNYVNLISIRLSRDIISNNTIQWGDISNSQHDSDEIQFQSRYVRMIQQLCQWSIDDDDDDESHHYDSLSQQQTRSRKFHVVVSSGPYMGLGLRHRADGVHFKEMHRSQIPTMRQFYRTLSQDDNIISSSLSPTTTRSTENQTRWRNNAELLVGTSVHSISSAIDAYTLYEPDYMFVGTCYETQSHPDKIDLEGPLLPSQVSDSLNRYIAMEQRQQSYQKRPLILGIGGIDETNCDTVVKPHQNSNNTIASSTSTTTTTCDGIAVIRSVLQSLDPAQTVTLMYHRMRNCWK